MRARHPIEDLLFQLDGATRERVQVAVTTDQAAVNSGSAGDPGGP
ncbi:hypothetical protein ACNPQM_05300 [Streptomyces sp. NPDC056231]